MDREQGWTAPVDIDLTCSGLDPASVGKAVDFV